MEKFDIQRVVKLLKLSSRVQNGDKINCVISDWSNGNLVNVFVTTKNLAVVE